MLKLLSRLLCKLIVSCWDHSEPRKWKLGSDRYTKIFDIIDCGIHIDWKIVEKSVIETGHFVDFERHWSLLLQWQNQPVVCFLIWDNIVYFGIDRISTLLFLIWLRKSRAIPYHSSGNPFDWGSLVFKISIWIGHPLSPTPIVDQRSVTAEFEVNG